MTAIFVMLVYYKERYAVHRWMVPFEFPIIIYLLQLMYAWITFVSTYTTVSGILLLSTTMIYTVRHVISTLRYQSWSADTHKLSATKERFTGGTLSTMTYGCISNCS
jgi:hypothetical protein